MTLNIPHRRAYALGAVLLLAAVLRFLFLSSVPNGFHSDEASIGYDAYSILHTGRDQYGEFLPLFARSFGDYDEALYRYLAVPFIFFFGLTEFATRLPAALSGILTVYVFYLLVREGFDDRTALVAALFLAISPWHIQFSRWAVRAILLPLFFCLGLLCFLRSFKKPALLLLSALFFAVCLHTYNAARVFVPLFMLGLVYLYRRELREMKKTVVLSGAVFLAIFIPLFAFWISPEGMHRAQTTLTTSPVAICLDYLSYFSPQFLFFSGDANLRHSLIHVGQLHHFEMLTVLAGLWGLIRTRRKERGVLWLWLVLYPVPAALTEGGHAIRSIAGAPLFALLSGMGVFVLADLLRPGPARREALLGGVIVVFLSLATYGKFLFSDYPRYAVGWWQYGMKELIEHTRDSAHPVIVSNRYYFAYPYIFALFYKRYSPAEYHALPLDSRRKLWVQTPDPFDRYFSLSLETVVFERGTCLMVIQPDELSKITHRNWDWRELHTIQSPEGDSMIKILEVKGRPSS